jgi:hypothetical protein
MVCSAGEVVCDGAYNRRMQRALPAQAWYDDAAWCAGGAACTGVVRYRLRAYRR